MKKDKERSAVTIRIMKYLYPNKRCKVSIFHLSKEDLLQLKKDRRTFGGLCSENNLNGELETLWLSPSGKKYIENINCQHGFYENIKNYFVRNYKWIINTIVNLLTSLTKFIL